MYQPTLKQLKYICAVADLKHFSKAAESCFVSQSALSTGINELEQNLGIQVFERHNKQVLITPLGQEIIDRARAILLQTNDLMAIAQQSSGGLIKQLHIGVIPTIAPFMLPEILNLLEKNHPDTRILIREDLSHNLMDMLNRGEIDTALMALPFATEDFITHKLFDDPLVLALPKTHEKAKQDSISVAELTSIPLLILEDGHCLRDHSLNACSTSISDLDIPYQASSLHTLLQMVGNKIGGTLLPKMAVESELVSNDLIQILPIEGATNMSREIALVWRKNYPNGEALEKLGNLIN
jgi:LysR family hydrogen peroxide-inducible transcriptional activator